MDTMAFISGMPGGSEVLLVLFIILLLFGAKKLPELSRSLGKSLGEFKKGKEDLEKEIRNAQYDVQKEAITLDPEPEPEPEPKPVDDISETEETVKAPPSEN